MAGLIIRPAAASDYADWRMMWDGYCAFYDVAMPEEVTQFTWARILDPSVPVHALIARAPGTGEARGMANFVLHDNTWCLTPVCYLEDLYTHPHVRGQGVGKALIDRLTDEGRAKGWARVYWTTRASNTRARRLYDLYAPADDFVRYVIKL